MQAFPPVTAPCDPRADLQSLVDAVEDMLFVIEPDGEVLYANPAVSRRLGHPPEEIVGRNIRALHPPERAAECDQVLAGLINGQASFCPVPFQTRDGGVIPAETRFSTGHWAGRPVLFGIARDIGDRVRAEQALRHSEQVLEQIFSTTGFLLAYMDRDFNFVRVNRAYAEGCNREPQGLVGLNHFALYPDAEAEAIFRRVVATGEPHYAEARPFEHPDQPERGTTWWDWTLSPVCGEGGEGGEVEGVLLSLVDVSERIHAQAEVSRLATVVDQAPVTIVITDLDARILYVNPYFERTTGYAPAEVLGRNPRCLQGGLHDRAFYQELWATLTAGQVWSGHLINRRKDGSLYHEAANIFPIRDPAGRITHYAGVKRNITRQIEAEEELARHREHLEELVAERTQALEREIAERRATEQALEEARAAAEAANHAKSAFLANMSHELRTPLNAVLGFSQLMARAPDIPPEHQRHLGIINRSGEHLLSMINDVLDLSRIEAGNSSLSPQVFHLEGLLRDLADMFRLRTQAKGLGFDLLLSPGLPEYVVSDPGKLRQVLINLLGNAVKFTDHGRVTLSAAASPRPDGGPTLLRLEVRDTGIGIDAEKIERLFEPFVQSGPLYRNQEGTGLGLAISRAFANLLGGALQAEACPGGGSRFRLEVPVQAAEAPQGEGGLDYRHVLGLEPGQPEWRFLVVDDEEANRALLAGLLAQAGFLVQSAASGAEAVQSFRDWSPQMVWLDMRMPGMDGFDTARAIRRLPGGTEATLVMVTAGALETRLKEVLETGCDDLLAKPFQAADLLRLVAKHLPVRYRMATAPAAARPATLTEGDFEELPLEWVRELHDAILSLDSDQILAVAARIADDQPQLAESIDAAAQTFRLDRLLALCEQTLGEGV